MNSKRFCMWATFLAIAVSWGQPLLHAKTVQRTFLSLSAATNALLQTTQTHDRAGLQALFGDEITNLLTGDKTLDEKHFAEFAGDLTEKCEVVSNAANEVTLDIGKEGWPFPVPLVQSNGVWFFDTLAGEDEIINRHIGRDEFYAIGVCRNFVKAEREYAARFISPDGVPHYAARFRSTPGKMDGLFWPAPAGTPSSPFAAFVAEASWEGYDWAAGNGPRPFHGYLFKILTRQGPDAAGGKMDYMHHGVMTGGFAMVAYPVRWGDSGIMTFIVNETGVVYQRSLGARTAKLAPAMKEYNPDGRWMVVQDAGITDWTNEPPVTMPPGGNFP